MPPQRLLPRGSQTQRHQGTPVRWVRLVDPDQRHTPRLELVGNERQVQLISTREHDGVRVGREVPWARLAGGVADHGGLDAAWYVRPHDHVVRDRVLVGAALSRDRVVEKP